LDLEAIVQHLYFQKPKHMLYIHHTYCISAQQDVFNNDINSLNDAIDKKYFAKEPGYAGIPPGILRRMGKAIRMGVGASLSIYKETSSLNGIIIGTANGGMEDCIKFLNQIVQYNEELLAPGNFVQSTNNAIAGQLGLLTANKGYNITHVNRGLAFENAMMDAMMQLNENPANSYLMGGVDELSAFNYNIEKLAGAYKDETVSLKHLYKSNSPGSVAGEGAAMFIVNKFPVNAIAKVEAVSTLHSEDERAVCNQLKNFLLTHSLEKEKINLFLTGENGDNRFLKFYTACESLIDNDTAIGRFKHLCGEYPTASSFALWLCCEILRTKTIPQHIYKRKTQTTAVKNILLYNNYKGYQHSFMLIKNCQ